jgi:hypothetical protein
MADAPTLLRTRIDDAPRTLKKQSRGLWACRAFFEFLRVDVVSVRGFAAMRQLVVPVPVKERQASQEEIDAAVMAVRDACVLYFKPALCLQRSIAATRMLRRLGAPAQLVIGCRPAPVASHAWVEIGGEIISDRMSGLEFYRVVDRW